MDRESILRILRQDLRAASKRAAIASAHFDEVVTIIPTGAPYRHNVHEIQNASREYIEARKAALEALMRLNDFLIHGTVPPGLEKEQEPHLAAHA